MESSDFRLKDSKDYYGLAPGKSVLLRWAYLVKCTNVILADDKETVMEVHVEYDRTKSTKPKGVIHWVARPSPRVEPLKVEVRHYDKLFKSEVCEASLSENGHESYDFWSGVGCFELVAKRMLAEVVQLLREKLYEALAIW